MNNLNIVNLTVEFIKNSNKETLTVSQTATTNFTGRIVEITNYKLRGQDLAEYVIGSKVTVCVSDEDLSQHILEAVEAEFYNRSQEGDMNPVIAINFRATKINQTTTGYLVYEVSFAGIALGYQAEQAISLEQFRQQAESIRRLTAEASEAALAKPRLRPQAQAMSAGLAMTKPVVTKRSNTEVPY